MHGWLVIDGTSFYQSVERYRKTPYMKSYSFYHIDANADPSMCMAIETFMTSSMASFPPALAPVATEVRVGAL